jgi:hypothetical protein
LALELAVIGFAYYKQDDFKDEINKVLNSTLYDYPKQGKEGIVRKTWDALQTDVIIIIFYANVILYILIIAEVLRYPRT